MENFETKQTEQKLEQAFGKSSKNIIISDQLKQQIIGLGEPVMKNNDVEELTIKIVSEETSMKSRSKIWFATAAALALVVAGGFTLLNSEDNTQTNIATENEDQDVDKNGTSEDDTKSGEKELGDSKTESSNSDDTKTETKEVKSNKASELRQQLGLDFLAINIDGEFQLSDGSDNTVFEKVDIDKSISVQNDYFTEEYEIYDFSGNLVCDFTEANGGGVPDFLTFDSIKKNSDGQPVIAVRDNRMLVEEVLVDNFNIPGSSSIGCGGTSKDIDSGIIVSFNPDGNQRTTTYTKSEGRITKFTNSFSDSLFALKNKDGEDITKLRFPSSYKLSEDGKIVVMSSHECPPINCNDPVKIVAVDTTSAEMLWELEGATSVEVIGKNKVLVSTGTQLLSLDRPTGRILARAAFQGEVRTNRID